MLSLWADRNQRTCFNKKSPLAFFTNLFKRKKYKSEKENERQDEYFVTKGAPKVPTTLSVSVMDMRMMSPCPLSPTLSTLTLTPGRTRDIDQDMEALRLSRQDNPFLQVLASRESLVESLFESESDDANLMSQEFPNDFEIDPLTLPEIHEHMIRSPPPTTWPKSPNYKVFKFPDESPMEPPKPKKSPVKMPRYGDFSEHDFGLYSTIHSTHSPRTSVVQRPHKRSSSECRDRPGNAFPVFKPAPMRSLSDVRRMPPCGTNDEASHAPSILPLLAKRTT